uniref:hypothetical protein n=1 Tax=Klebsiella pneumoniae TaxID=573 RepID=UPI00300B1E0C
DFTAKEKINFVSTGPKMYLKTRATGCKWVNLCVKKGETWKKGDLNLKMKNTQGCVCVYIYIYRERNI